MIDWVLPDKKQTQRDLPPSVKTMKDVTRQGWNMNAGASGVNRGPGAPPTCLSVWAESYWPTRMSQKPTHAPRAVWQGEISWTGALTRCLLSWGVIWQWRSSKLTLWSQSWSLAERENQTPIITRLVCYEGRTGAERFYYGPLDIFHEENKWKTKD